MKKNRTFGSEANQIRKTFCEQSNAKQQEAMGVFSSGSITTRLIL
jgi:hypothetical protein